ncbi:hypothetical protein L0128_23090 [candidate division KSB1 bacterium]|nr:hypothetical protein [candidate division KSB1 bacterium]
MRKFWFAGLILLLLGFLFCSSDQQGETTTDQPTTGVRFEKLSLDQALQKAQQENKLLLIDAYSHG